jgi:ribosomal protein S18 acetylase RimI-like enzyme
MKELTIRPARANEFDAVADVWMRSWSSIGIESTSEKMLRELRARIPREIENGWSLYVAEDAGRIVAMLAFRLRDAYLDQLFIAPEYHSKGLGKRLLAFTRAHLPNEIWLRCSSQNERAWRWYEREGFVLEREEVDAALDRPMRYYRWKRGTA